MESTHGQLGSRFTNGLCSHKTNCVTHIYQVTTRQITTITLLAYAKLSFTSNRRTHLNAINTLLINQRNQFFIQQGSRFNNHLAFGILNVLTYYATKNTLA